MNFQEFKFDTNVVSGEVSSLQKWVEILAVYRSYHPDTDLYQFRQSSIKGHFGSRREHQHSAELTLGEFFDLHGMEKI